MLVQAFNPEVTDLEKSYLANSYSSGVTSVQVTNNDRFAANDRMLIGTMGTEKAEIVTVSAVSADGLTVTVGATVFSHAADEPVYKLRFDQAKFYRSTTGATGVYSVISTQSLDVDNANLMTLYDDVSGTSSYYYKVTFYHSISAVESALSDPIQGSGYRREQVGYIVDQILQEVSDQNEIHVTRSELLGYFNDVNDDLQTNVGRPYDFLHARTALSRTANTNYLDFPVDTYGKQTMWKFDYMDYNFTDSTTTPLTNRTTTLKVMPEPEFRNTYSDNTVSATTVTDDTPAFMCLDTSVNRFRFSAPFATSLANVFYLHYWKYLTTIDSEGDVIETPTPKIYKLYCKSMYYAKRAIADVTLGSTAQAWDQKYQRELTKYKPVDRKDQGTPRNFRPQTSTTKSYRR